MVIIATGALGLWLAVPSVVLGLLVIAVLGGLATRQCDRPEAPHGAQGDRRSWSAEQTGNTQLIISTVTRRGLPRRAAVLAVATALAESGLRNLHTGDRDSLGLFQQRPSQGWGHPTQLLNPSYATDQFLNHLLAVPGWAHLA
ncbi:MAG TPA: NlpC/P60 family protein, partial [Pseudonocardia sp.]